MAGQDGQPGSLKAMTQQKSGRLDDASSGSRRQNWNKRQNWNICVQIRSVAARSSTANIRSGRLGSEPAVTLRRGLADRARTPPLHHPTTGTMTSSNPCSCCPGWLTGDLAVAMPGRAGTPAASRRLLAAGLLVEAARNLAWHGRGRRSGQSAPDEMINAQRVAGAWALTLRKPRP